MLNPRVTIIIPVYNAEKYLQETLNCVLTQTYKNIEVFIGNDGSTDGSQKIIDDFYEKWQYTFLMHIDKHENIGATLTRHRLLEFSDSKYYLPLDADDLIDPTFLEKTVPILEENSEIGFVYTNTEYFGIENIHFDQSEYNFIKLIEGNYICYCSLIRKQAYNEAGGYNLENIGRFEDYELWLKMGKKGWYGKHLAEELFHYRVHKESAMQGNFIANNGDAIKAYIITKYPEIFPIAWQEPSKEILKNYDLDFMSRKY
jgi:glycosyltransferase involved in cell wall biosynthesis